MDSRIMHIITTILLSNFMISALIGCSNNNAKPSDSAGFDVNDFMTAEGFVIDNDPPLATLLTEEYALADLNAFFGDNVCQGDRILEHARNLKIYTWEEVNSQFPVQCLRYYKNVHYSVYKVRNGGYYYVFWQVPVTTVSYRSAQHEKLEITAVASVYLDKLSTISSFEAIKKGRSTARDVAEIDPTMELDLFSSSTCSYSLLNDGRVLVVNYSFNKLECLEDLIVEKISIYSKDDVLSKITAISSADLKKTGDGSLS